MNLVGYVLAVGVLGGVLSVAGIAAIINERRR
jgi:hypothetical protein